MKEGERPPRNEEELQKKFKRSYTEFIKAGEKKGQEELGEQKKGPKLKKDANLGIATWAEEVAKELAPIIHDSLRIWTGRAGLAGLTAVFVGRFSRRLGVDVRGSSGGTGRVDQGPWAAMQPAIATRALR